jgi:hypothetical protein
MIAPPVPSEHAWGFDCLFGHKTTATPFGTHQAWSAGEAATRIAAISGSTAFGNLLMNAPPSVRERARAAGTAFNNDKAIKTIIPERRLHLKDL